MANEKIPLIERPGVRAQFKPVRTYLKLLAKEKSAPEMLDKLHQYASDEDAQKLGTECFLGDLMRATWALRRAAMQAALGGKEENWQAEWQRAIVYQYWMLYVNKKHFELAFADMGNDPRWASTLAGSKVDMTSLAVGVADCLIQGWQEWALDLSRLAVWVIEHDAGFDMSQSYHRRTQYFIFRLMCDWQGWPPFKAPKCAFDEPLFNALIAHWRTPDPNDIAPLLLAACDRHTHQCRYGGEKDYDFEFPADWYDPVEALVVMKLREMHGLENPVLDHVLMNTPLGRLPEASSPPPCDELLERILARMRKEYPDFHVA